MKGKVKDVKRSRVERRPQGYLMPGEYGTIETTTYATLEDGNNVEIPEDMVRGYYNRERITDTLVNKLKEDLKDKEIEYEQDDDGNLTLIGDLGTYILPNYD